MRVLSQLPNALSILRLLAAPYVFFCPAGGRLWFLALISSTDFLDGYLARKLNAISKFGTFVDPLGDKAVAIAFAFVFWLDGVFSFPQVMIFFSRECSLILFFLYALRAGKWREWHIQSFWCGKIATLLQAIIVGYLCLGYEAVPTLVYGLMALAGILALPELIYRMSFSENRV